MRMIKERLQKWVYGERLRLFLVSLAVGLFFTMVVYSPRVLDPTYVEWTNNPGTDISAHYNGWHVFQHERWQYPLGHIESVLAPYGTSMSMTDSIPLFAFIFKLLRPLLPYHFQYFGWFVVLCYTLQYYFGVLLLRLRLKDRRAVYLGAGFFMLSPVMMWRAFEHTALTAHFVVLAGIYLFLKNEYKNKAFACWTALLITALLIHPYMMAMAFILFCGYILNYMVGEKKVAKPLLLLAANTALILLVAQVIGIFSMYETDESFGLYSLNLNSLINSRGYSRLMLERQVVYGQTEGYAYLGMAVMIMGACALMLGKDNLSLFKGKKAAGLAAVSAVTLFLALTNQIYWGSRLLLEYQLPQPLLNALQAFRASGRFFWILYYFILLFIVVNFARLFEQHRQPHNGHEQWHPRRLIACLLALLALQAYDILPVIQKKKTVVNTVATSENAFTSEFWSRLNGYFDLLVVAPYDTKYYIDLVDIVLRNNMVMNIGATSRVDANLIYGGAVKQLENMERGQGEIRTLYIVASEELQLRPAIAEHYHILRVDGVNVCIDKRNTQFIDHYLK